MELFWNSSCAISASRWTSKVWYCAWKVYFGPFKGSHIYFGGFEPWRAKLIFSKDLGYLERRWLAFQIKHLIYLMKFQKYTEVQDIGKVLLVQARDDLQISLTALPDAECWAVARGLPYKRPKRTAEQSGHCSCQHEQRPQHTSKRTEQL